MIESLNATIFPFEPDRTTIEIRKGIGGEVVLFENASNQALLSESRSRLTYEAEFILTSKDFDNLTQFFEARKGMVEPFILPSWTRDAKITTLVSAGSNAIIVDDASLFSTTPFAFGNIIVLYNLISLFASYISSISGNVITLKTALPFDVNSNTEVFLGIPVRFMSDQLSRQFQSADYYRSRISFAEVTDPIEIAKAVETTIELLDTEWHSAEDLERGPYSTFNLWDFLILPVQYRSNRYPISPSVLGRNAYAVQSPEGDVYKLWSDGEYEIQCSLAHNWDIATHSGEFETNPTVFQFRSDTNIHVSVTNKRLVIYASTSNTAGLYAGQVQGYDKYEFPRLNTYFQGYVAGITAIGSDVLEVRIEGDTIDSITLHPGLGVDFTMGLRIPDRYNENEPIGWLIQNCVASDTPIKARVYGETIGFWRIERGFSWLTNDQQLDVGDGKIYIVGCPSLGNPDLAFAVA